VGLGSACGVFLEELLAELGGFKEVVSKWRQPPPSPWVTSLWCHHKKEFEDILR
jgi:hypothetical protein